MADNPPNPPPNPNNPNSNSNSSKPTTQQPSASKPSSSPPAPSLASRISSSATGLLNSTFSPRAAAAGADIPGTLAAGLSSKGSSSSSSSSNHVFSGGATSLARGGGSGSRGSTSFTPQGATFRSNASVIGASSVAQERGDSLLEMEFLQDLEFEALSRSGLQTPINDKGKGKEKEKEKEKTLDPDEKDAFERAWHSSSTTIETTETEPDGAAVSSLLSDPSFQPMFTLDAEDQDYDISDEPNPFLAPPQTVTPSPSGNKPLNPLSLLPGLSDLLSTLPPLPTTNSSTGVQQPLTESDISRLESLLSESSALREQNEPWLALDEVYHDAVWGNWIEPYVRAAKEEVEAEVASGKGDEDGVRDGPAVRRLGAILGHLRARL